MDLSNNLRTARKQAGLSQTEVAQRLNITRQAISQWENGKSYPDIDNLKLLSDVYGFDFADIVNDNVKLQQKPGLPEKQNEEKQTEQPTNTPAEESLILLLLSCILFPIAPMGIIIAPFIIWRNKRTNRFWRLILLIAICALIYNIYVLSAGFSDFLGFGTTSYK